MPLLMVDVDKVSKKFVVRKDKSLKERIVNAAISRSHREEFWALNDLSFSVREGETVALIGHNGSGKSTLLKMIGGILVPDTGSIKVRGRIAALLELGAGFHPDLTGRENIFLNAAILGLNEAETRKRFDDIVAFSGVEEFIDTQVKFYSSGMYVRLAFAVSVHIDPDILLVDEVLAVGDEPFQRKCMERIREFQAEGRTIILVSHSASQVEDVCTRAVLLESGNAKYDGDPKTALRMLHHGYEERISADQARQDQFDRINNDGALRLGNPKVSCPQVTEGPQGLCINVGDTLVIEGDAVAPSKIIDWKLGVSIESPMGEYVFTMDTLDLGVELPQLVGKRQFRIELPELVLADGDYLINISARRHDGELLDRLSRSLRFTVKREEITQGKTKTKPVVSVH